MMRSSRRLLASFCFLLAGAGVVDAQRPAATDRFLVIPFDNPGHEARIYWLGEASAILLADNLNTGAGAPRAYTREERLEAFEQLQVPPVVAAGVRELREGAARGDDVHQSWISAIGAEARSQLRSRARGTLDRQRRQR